MYDCRLGHEHYGLTATPFHGAYPPLFASLPLCRFFHSRHTHSSNYYIEVFSRRYWQSMEAEAAAKAEALVLKAAKRKAREAARQNGGKEDPLPAMLEEYPGRSFSGLSTSSSLDERLAWADAGEDKTDDSPVDDDDEEDGVEENGSGVDDPETAKSKDV